MLKARLQQKGPVFQYCDQQQEAQIRNPSVNQWQVKRTRCLCRQSIDSSQRLSYVYHAYGGIRVPSLQPTAPTTIPIQSLVEVRCKFRQGFSRYSEPRCLKAASCLRLNFCYRQHYAGSTYIRRERKQAQPLLRLVHEFIYLEICMDSSSAPL
jgi:hypothetical protein